MPCTVPGGEVYIFQVYKNYELANVAAYFNI